MQLRKLKANEPRSKRTLDRPSTFELTPMWKRIEKEILGGAEIEAIISKEDQEAHSLGKRRSVARFIQKYIETAGLPYMVKSFERRETGSFVIQVLHAAERRRRA